MISSTETSQFSFPSFSQSHQVNSTTNPEVSMPLSINALSTTSSQMSTSLSYSMPSMCISVPPETKQLLSKSSEARRMVSFLASPRQRAESFIIEEVRLMLQEIELRKHVLLSLSPSTHRLKRRAWEEVAAAMAVQWPHTPRRTAYQVKKKWENLVSKTKRKIRAGHITSDLDWSETNSVVLEFLIQHSPLVRQRYSMALNSDLNCPTNAPFTEPATAIAMMSGNASTTSPLPASITKTSDSLLSRAGGLSLNSQPVDNLLPIFPNSSNPYMDTSEMSKTVAANNVLTTGISASKAFVSNTVLEPLVPNFGHQEDIKVNILHNEVDVGQVREELHTVPTQNSLDEGERYFRSPREQLPQVTVDQSDSQSSAQPKGEGSMANLMDQPLFPMQLPSCTELPNCSPELQNCLMKQYEKEHHLRVEVLSLQKRAWELQIELLQSRINTR